MKGWERTYLDNSLGTSLAVQWLRLQAPNARDTGLIPGWGTKILHATWFGQKKKKRELFHSFTEHITI